MTLKLDPDALTCPSGYSLDLYCKWLNPLHEWMEFPHGYLGETRAEVVKSARAAGWVIHPDNTATCPKCRSLPKESC